MLLIGGDSRCRLQDSSSEQVLGAEYITHLQVLSVRYSGDHDDQDPASALQEFRVHRGERPGLSMVLPGSERHSWNPGRQKQCQPQLEGTQELGGVGEGWAGLGREVCVTCGRRG